MIGWKDLYRHYLNLRAPDGASTTWSWQRCRSAFLKIVGKQCSCCSSTKRIEVHHILPRHIRPDLSVDMTNLIALCKGCHLRIGHLGSYYQYNETVMDVAMYVKKHSKLKLNKVA
jgi:5-methylcytosine-specific restriction endonuclease McrA